MPTTALCQLITKHDAINSEIERALQAIAMGDINKPGAMGMSPVDLCFFLNSVGKTRHSILGFLLAKRSDLTLTGEQREWLLTNLPGLAPQVLPKRVTSPKPRAQPDMQGRLLPSLHDTPTQPTAGPSTGPAVGYAALTNPNPKTKSPPRRTVSTTGVDQVKKNDAAFRRSSHD